MLKLTKKADYGLIALRHLASMPGATASAKDIAEAYHLPVPLLAKVLQQADPGGHPAVGGRHQRRLQTGARRRGASARSKWFAPSTAR